MIKKSYINIFIYILIFLIVPVTFIDVIAPKVFDILQLISISFMVICILVRVVNRKKVDSFEIVMLINSLLLFFTSAINNTLTYNVAFSIISTFAIPTFLKNSFKEGTDSIKALYYIYIVIIFLNLITSFFKIRIGYLSYSFIGGKNSIALTVIPAMLIIHIYSLLKYNKLTRFNIFMLVICIISLIISGSSTAIVIALWMILYFFMKSIKLSLKKIIIIYLIISVMIIFGTEILQQTFINTIIKELFDKDLTFTSRTVLWDISLEYFIKSPFIGYGRNNSIIYDSTGGHLDQSHNMILQLLLVGGIFSLIMLFIILYISFKRNDSNNNIDKFILFYFFSYIIIGLTESIIFVNQLWMIFALAYSSREICSNYKNINSKNLKENKYDKKNTF